MAMYYPVALYLLLQIVTRTTARLLYENAIEHNPRIMCKEGEIGVAVETANPYFGRMFVNGMSKDPYCIRRFNSKSRKGQLMVPIGACDMRVERVSQPRVGVEYSTMMVVSFHSDLLTESDRIFHVKCRYYQADQSIGSFYEVGILPTIVLTNSYPLPMCKYSLHLGKISGKQAQFARIGDPVYHLWQCDSDVYAIKIKSCFVDDGQYKKYMLIDKNGCPSDKVILPEIQYDRAMNFATAKTHVFKFADRPHVFFRCQLALCFKHEPSCQHVTPPNCNYRYRRALAEQSPQETAGEIEISSQSLVVLDIGDERKLDEYITTSDRSCPFCVTGYGFLALIVCNLVCLMLSTLLSVALCRRSNKHNALRQLHL